MNDWFSSLFDDWLTYGMSYEISTMGTSVDEDTHAKSWMTVFPMMLGNNEGGLDGRDSSFTEC